MASLEDLDRQERSLRLEAEAIARRLQATAAPAWRQTLAARLAQVTQALGAASAERQRAERAVRPAEQRVSAGGAAAQGGAAPMGGGGTTLGKDTTGLDARATLRMTHVPTSIVHLLDERTDPLVTVTVRASRDARVRVMVEVAGYSARAVRTVELRKGKEASLDLLPTFFPERLREVTELTRATVAVSVDDLDGKTEDETTFPVWLLARTTAALYVEDPGGGTRDLTRFLAAWVTPNAEPVTALLREAAALHPANQLVGYQADEADVEQQVQAIYAAVKKAGLTYVNSIVAFGNAPGQFAQRVRLPSESLRVRCANCIDGTVLLASLLEAASLNPAIVLVPGHAFLGWQRWTNGKWDYLETTLLGHAEFPAAHERGVANAELWTATGQLTLLPLPELRVEQGIAPAE
jgi:hypothetical protein